MNAIGACWVDGRIVDPAAPAIPAADHGLLVGDGVFETLKVTRGVAFALTRHLVRLRRSAAALGLDCPDDERMAEAVAEVLAADPEAGRLRMTLTGGVGPLGSERGEVGPSLILLTGAGRPPGEAARVVTVPWPRNERSPLAGVKSTSYAENVVALAAARRQGATEALLPNTSGYLCEGTGSNVFVALDGRLVTPPLSSGCLAGITRELVLAVVDAIERPITMAELSAASEVFITSSTRDVQPVSSVDGIELAPCPGPLTSGAMAAWSAAYTDVPDP